MNLNIRTTTCLLAGIALSLSACKKDASEAAPQPQPQQPADQIQVHNTDQNNFANESDAVNADVLASVESSAYFSGRTTSTLQNASCDAEVSVDTMAKKITVTYKGGSCLPGRVRTGKVVMQLTTGNRWKDVGAVLTLTYDNVKIAYGDAKKYIVLDGTQTLTNESGGRMIDLFMRNTITHTLRSSNMSITFEDGTKRTWQIARRRVYTNNNGLVLTVTGLHTDGSRNAISEWGTNRFGQPFSTAISSAIVVKQDCNFRITEGAISHAIEAGVADIQFGLNATGAPTPCPASGNYYFKLTWTPKTGNPVSVIRPY